MKFDFSPMAVINSRTKMKVVNFLLNHEASMSEREIASVLDVSHMSVNRIMKELANMNFVNYLTVGKAHLWKVNRRSYTFTVLSRLLTDISKIDNPLNDLKKTIRESLPRAMVKKVVLFGSVAKGLERENSDIDVFFLVKNKKMKEQIEPYIEQLSNKCVDLYGNRLAPYILTEHEAKQRKDLGVLAEINQGIQIIPGQE
ncbi:MAG: nucleotidyltransferase domain-containing protein [Candidatus Aminicenantes bacterium]|nr:nucleotidyltransferase domain-containing protein [Candidatus Aminicenantes bacterium]